MKLSRVLSSTMPVILASPFHWSVSSWIGDNVGVGFSMPTPLDDWPVTK